MAELGRDRTTARGSRRRSPAELDGARARRAPRPARAPRRRHRHRAVAGPALRRGPVAPTRRPMRSPTSSPPASPHLTDGSPDRCRRSTSTPSPATGHLVPDGPRPPRAAGARPHVHLRTDAQARRRRPRRRPARRREPSTPGSSSSSARDYEVSSPKERLTRGLENLIQRGPYEMAQFDADVAALQPDVRAHRHELLRRGRRRGGERPALGVDPADAAGVPRRTTSRRSGSASSRCGGPLGRRATGR